MFQRDYFMRMIEQIGEVSGVLLGLRKEKKQQEALQFIDEQLDKLFRMNGKLIRSLSDTDLIKMMSRNGVVETANVQSIALLLKEEGDLHEEMEDPEAAYASRLKSLHLFARMALLDAQPLVKPAAEMTMELLQTLRQYELPSQTKLLMAEFYEGERRYDKAEDMNYELMEDGVLPAEEMGEFYRRLLLLPEDILTAGGLPRDEVSDGLSRLKL
ncbi:hypothetical protein FHS18_000546 [Paenibacillus phyllosphaerae]|uniref:Uncharacterized protein n=1 Tax=Paenibacillus phyllosphaerae TaxID=274593 RepID=A0A7W5ATR8_9BACL|nr:DUF6483 family protein [Paenibacillus phyllosphaerae]MBB3108518.1 hypothetical protein [Paenibacillus phyllosphaerae]